MERFIALLTWVALAAVLIAAFVVRHEPPRSNVQQRLRPRRSERSREGL
jgi:hypothetical protein